ncbi:MAG: tetratricopeptide repeat protein, partial [Nitrospirota bacterium]|nr:tetratricopeptide repeat protein [Nitrospirota bacterium]
GDIEKAKKFTQSNSFLSDRLYNLQAVVYLKIGNYSAALESLGELISRWPALKFLEWKIEIEDIDKIIKKFPNDFRGYIVRGIYYSSILEDKSFELSIVDYKRALSLNPKYALGYYLLGEAYSNKAMFNFNIETPEEYQSALKAFTKAIELNLKPSKDVNVFYGRGTVYLRLENYKEAIKDFSKAIEIDPKESFEDRGDAYFELGNYRQALADYDNAIKLKRSDKSWDVFTMSFLYRLYKKKGDAYFKMGNYKQAINAYDKTVEYYHSAYVDKNYPNKNYPKGVARPARPAAPAAAPGTPTTLSLIYEKRGICHFELGNYELALRDLDEAIEIPPIFNAHADAYYYRGLTHEKLGNHQQAIKDVKVAAKRGVKAAQAFLKSKGIKW